MYRILQKSSALLPRVAQIQGSHHAVLEVLVTGELRERDHQDSLQHILIEAQVLCVLALLRMTHSKTEPPKQAHVRLPLMILVQLILQDLPQDPIQDQPNQILEQFDSCKCRFGKVPSPKSL